MLKFSRRVLAAALLVCLLGAAAWAEAKLVVLPIDRAKFWVGQKFDMEVELRGAKAEEIKITLNGKDAGEFFKADKVFKADDLFV